MAGRTLNGPGYAVYLANKRDIKLTLKTSKTPSGVPANKVGLADPATNKIVKTVPAGSEVVFNSTGLYNRKPSPWYVVSHGKEMYNVHWSSIVKPGRESIPSIKPQQLGAIGKFKTVDELAQKIFKGMKTKEHQFAPETFQYMSCLLGRHSSIIRQEIGIRTIPEIDKFITQNWPAWKDILPLRDIGKDFGEMLGPMWLAEGKYALSHQRSLLEIDFPAEGNFPLVDYFMTFKRRDGQIVTKKYSAKSKVAGVKGNTVKLTTVYDEIHGWPTKRKTAFINKWKSCWLYEMIEIAHKAMSRREKVAEVNLMLREYAIKNKLTRSTKTGTGFWTDLSKDQSDVLKRFFSEFIQENVYYIVFNVDMKTGLPKYVFDIDALKATNVRLKELSEQLGFDPVFGEREDKL